MGLTGILPAIDLLPVLAALAFAYVGALNGEADAKPALYYGIGPVNAYIRDGHR